MFIKNNKGYTLVEISLVAVIVAVVISVTIAIFVRVEKQSWAQVKTSAIMSTINIMNNINKNKGGCPLLSDIELANLGTGSPLTSYFGAANPSVSGLFYTCASDTISIKFVRSSVDISDGTILLQKIIANRLSGYTVSSVNVIEDSFTISWFCKCL